MDKTDRLLKKMIPDPIVPSGLVPFEIPNHSGMHPDLKLKGFSIVSDGTYVDITNGSTSIFRIKPSATETYLYGGNTTGDDLFLYGSSADAQGHVDIYGNGNVVVDGQASILLRISGSAVGTFGSTQTTLMQNVTWGSGILMSSGVVATADATPTTLQTIALTADTAYYIDTIVIGEKTDGATNAMYHIEGLFFRDGAGNATQTGATTTISAIEADAAWDCAFGVSTTNVVVTVTGKAATAIRWKSITKTTQVTAA